MDDVPWFRSKKLGNFTWRHGPGAYRLGIFWKKIPEDAGTVSPRTDSEGYRYD
jgi:hypothetical protein